MKNKLNTYTLMHANDIVAVADRSLNKVDILLPSKMPFGLRDDNIDFISFYQWLNKRASNLERTYMSKVYIARKVNRDIESVIRDSCGLSITDQFWINTSDINMTWDKLQEKKDENEVLADVALTGNTENIDWSKALEGTTSLFATKGSFPKAIMKSKMLKCGGAQQNEWIAYVIGIYLNIPVQKVIIKNPSLNNSRDKDGSWLDKISKLDNGLSVNPLDDTLVEIDLFTSDSCSLVHASELLHNKSFNDYYRDGQHHMLFYNELKNDSYKRKFEKILILNWLISNHDMHGENYGCTYCPNTFEITGVAPSYDHNSSDFDGTIPELDVPEIVLPNLSHHIDIINKIKNGALDKALSEIKNWLSPEQKQGIQSVARILIENSNNYFKKEFYI